MSDTITNYDEEVTVTELAELITNRVGEDETLWEMAEKSPEPYRFMVYESGAVEDPSALDGTDFYADLVDKIAEIY